MGFLLGLRAIKGNEAEYSNVFFHDRIKEWLKSALTTAFCCLLLSDMSLFTTLSVKLFNHSYLPIRMQDS